MNALDNLRFHYTHRLVAAREAHARGARVVGVVGNTIPRELVLAADCFPVLISAESGKPTPVADVYMEEVIPPETRALFELALSGELEFLDLLVLSRPYAHLFYYLKEVYRLGQAPRVPPLYLFDLMQSQREAAHAYNRAELNAFIRRLEHLTGRSLGDAQLASTMERTNRVRALQRELQDRRWQRMLSGAHALQAIGAGYFMASENYADALREYQCGLAPDPDLTRRPRLLVLSSEPLSHLDLHTALESDGALVVAEGDWWGSRAPGSDIATNTSPRAAILDKYWRDTATSQVTPAKAREAWFREQAVRADVDGVVFYLPPSDRQLGWDYPRLKAWVDERGKPALRLRSDLSAVADWLDSLQLPAAGGSADKPHFTPGPRSVSLPAPERDTARQRHQELTQLEVTRTLRNYQREWFARLRKDVFEPGRPYVIGGALVPHEVFEALDLPFMTDVWYSGLVAARRQSAYYSNFLTQMGYHEDLSRYGSLALAVLLDEDNPDKPWGGISRPALVVTGADDRAADALAQVSGAVRVVLEMPSLHRLYPNWWEMSRWQWEDLDETPRIDVMLEQLEELVAAAERIAGKKLDLDRLREIVDRVNQQEEYFDEVRTIIATAPKLPARLGEVMSQTMGIQWHRGTEWALNQARAFRDEVKDRAEREMWVCPNERYRLMYVGAGLWQNLDFFTEFEDKYGAVFVRSNYLSIASDGYLRYGTRDPLRCLASRYVALSEQMHIPGLGGTWAVWEAKRHRVDGGVSLGGWWGQRMVNLALEKAGIPVVDFPVDPVDANSWDDAKLRFLISDFIETRLSGVT